MNNLPVNNLVAVTLVKNDYKIKAQIKGMFIYSPDMDLNNYFDIQAPEVINLLISKEHTKAFMYAEQSVATLTYNNLHTVNFISVNSIIKCLELPYDIPQTLMLRNATEHGIVNTDTISALRQYTIELYNSCTSAMKYLHQIVPTTRRNKLIEALNREINVLPSIIALNLTGVKFDYESWKLQLKEIKKDCDNLEHTISQKLKINNINSSKQLLQALNTLGVNINDTAETTLKGHVDENTVINDILKYRKSSKILHNYGENLLKYLDNNSRLYGIYTAYGAKTGRTSAKTVAIQGLPRSAKHCICADKGNIVVTADYTSVEMGILAHLSCCKTMVDEINNGIDLHRKVGGILFNVPIDSVSDDQRQVAKKVNFGIVYGISSYGLYKNLIAEGIDITLEQTSLYIRKYFDYYKEIESWQRECKTAVGITSKGGRYHSLLNSTPNQAINFAVQATGSDILKEALIILDSIIKNNDSYKLTMVVHDSISLEVPLEYKEKAEYYLRQAMMQAFHNFIPDVNINIDFSYNKEVNRHAI